MSSGNFVLNWVEKSFITSEQGWIKLPTKTKIHKIWYTDPKWKLYIVFKSIYFDDKFSFGVNFFGHRIFNALSMSLKKLLDKNQKLHNFYE